MPVSIDKAKVKTVKVSNITKDKHKIKMAKGITEQSTRNDVLKAYGVPITFSSNPESTILTYESRGDLKTKESIKFEFKNDKLNTIVMDAGVDKHKADNNTRFDTQENHPKLTKLNFVNKLKTKNEFLMDPEIVIGNLKVKRGTTLGEFYDDDWEVESIETYRGNRYGVTIKKGNATAYVALAGDIEGNIGIQSSLQISSIRIDANNEIPLILPKGLDETSKVQEYIDTFGIPNRYDNLFDTQISINYDSNTKNDEYATMTVHFDMQGNLKSFCLAVYMI